MIRKSCCRKKVAEKGRRKMKSAYAFLNFSCPTPGAIQNTRMVTCVCMAESLHCSLETITTLLIRYTPIENIFGVKKEINKIKKNTVSLFFLNHRCQHQSSYFWVCLSLVVEKLRKWRFQMQFPSFLDLSSLNRDG